MTGGPWSSLGFGEATISEHTPGPELLVAIKLVLQLRIGRLFDSLWQKPGSEQWV